MTMEASIKKYNQMKRVRHWISLAIASQTMA
jgi:hypothetical protein